MKLKKLLFATMFACAFASCSSDDDPVIDNGGGDEAADATLEIQIKTPSTTKTAMPLDDAKINSLQLVVFGTDDKVAYLGTKAGKAGENVSVKTNVKAGVQEVLVLANAKANIEVDKTTKADILAMEKSFTTESTENGFSMNSRIFTVDVEAGKTNYVGYKEPELSSEIRDGVATILDTNPVKLYRNVAKIVLKTVRISPNIDEKRYPDATLNIKSAFLLHAHTKTKIASSTEWGAINIPGAYLNGSSNADYGKWVDYMKDKKEIYPYIQTSIYNTEVAYKTDFGSEASITNGTTKFYAYENTEAEEAYRTLLVVEADFNYNPKGDNNEEPVTSSGRFYPIAVGYSGSLDFSKVDFADLRGDNLEGLLRNLEYNVELDVKGPGYTTPFGPKGDEDTFLDVQVQVVAFGQVNQSTEIE